MIVAPVGEIHALCECNGGLARSEFRASESKVADYFLWRSGHSGFRHNRQTFRTADEGPRARYGCTCGDVYSAPAGAKELFAWAKTHRKHGIKGEIS